MFSVLFKLAILLLLIVKEFIFIVYFVGIYDVINRSKRGDCMKRYNFYLSKSVNKAFQAKKMGNKVASNFEKFLIKD